MEQEEKRFQCEHCNAQFDLATLTPSIVARDEFFYQSDTDDTFFNQAPCLKCGETFKVVLTPDEYRPISKMIWDAREEWLDRAFDEIDRLTEEQERSGKSEGRRDEQSSALTQPESGKTMPPVSEEHEIDKVEAFIDEIKEIDKNLLPHKRHDLIVEALGKLIDEPEPRMEACFAILKKEFRLTAREIEAFRKYMNGKRAQLAKERKQKEEQEDFSSLAKPPKVLTEEEKEVALAYLRDPNLLSNISRDIAFAGEIVGEEMNSMMLYLAGVSRKFDRPISLVIFGQSSSGKSVIANAIEKFIPPEDKLIISSASPRAFEYMGNYLKHKFLLIQEWEGTEGILPTIRLLQSEGKLNRAVAPKDPDGKKSKSIQTDQECPCCVVLTTTKARIHDENATRIFESYTDESIQQTERVVAQNIKKASRKYRKSEKDKQRVFELHHDIQRMLDPLQVDIPFVDHLSFPAKSTRNRRDSERFIQLIKAVAFLRQKQKQMMVIDGEKWIEADLDDYEFAYHLSIHVIRATLDQISERARNVLRVCCVLDDERKNAGQPPFFTPKDISEKAPKLGMDFGAISGLYKHLELLTEHEYLELEQTPGKRKKIYRVCFTYERDHTGKVVNIDAPEIKEIRTPTELRLRLQQAEIS